MGSSQGFGGQSFGGGSQQQQQQKIYQTDKLEVEPEHAFTDTISQVAIQKLDSGSQQGRYVCAASSWDGKLQIFEIMTDQN